LLPSTTVAGLAPAKSDLGRAPTPAQTLQTRILPVPESITPPPKFFSVAYFCPRNLSFLTLFCDIITFFCRPTSLHPLRYVTLLSFPGWNTGPILSLYRADLRNKSHCLEDVCVAPLCLPYRTYVGSITGTGDADLALQSRRRSSPMRRFVPSRPMLPLPSSKSSPLL
jgi:hypothetical protein